MYLSSIWDVAIPAALFIFPVLLRATDYKFTVVVPVKAQSRAVTVQWLMPQTRIKAQPSFHGVEVAGYRKKAICPNIVQTHTPFAVDPL